MMSNEHLKRLICINNEEYNILNLLLYTLIINLLDNTVTPTVSALFSRKEPFNSLKYQFTKLNYSVIGSCYLEFDIWHLNFCAYMQKS